LRVREIRATDGVRSTLNLNVLLRHKNVAATQLYTQVMQKPGLGVKSPLDAGR